MRKIILKIGFLLSFAPVLTGSIFYEPRLALLAEASISLNTVAFLVAFLCAMSDLPRHPKKFALLFVLVFAILFYGFLAVVLRNQEPQGFMKYFNFLFLGFLFAFFVHALSQRGYFKWCADIIIIVLISLFIGAVVMKLQTGFWARHNPYFMHGSIVFGRLMAIGLIINLISPLRRGNIAYILNIIFMFGIIWSLSKGPILAISLTGLIYLFLNVSRLFSIRNIIFISLLVGICSYLISIYGVPSQLARVMVIVDLLFSRETSVNTSGSTGIRVDMYKESFEMIAVAPGIGVGMGGWGEHYLGGSTKFTYPHNLFLELFSELGIFLGLIFSFLLTLPLLYIKDPFFYLFLFLLLAQQVSGDMADGRFLSFAAFMILFRNLMLDYVEAKRR
jgi:O-antigen ligase